MTDSILNTTKKLLGIAEENTEFDPDIIMCINSVFTILAQLGVGPSSGFSIHDDSSTWNDFMSETENGEKVEAVKNYIALKVRLMFDPPTSSTVMQAVNSMISELEWRLNVLCDTTYSVSNEIEYVNKVLEGILNAKY